MKHELSVSVCIATYNQAQYVKLAIASALTQTYPIDEIWVSDDASTDDTAIVMADIVRKYPKVRYFQQPKNLGVAGNTSWVLSQPKTDLLVRLCSDDLLEPDFVRVMVTLMEKFPRAGYGHTNIFEIDTEGTRTKTRRLFPRPAYEPPDLSLLRCASGYRVAANVIIYRSEALRAAGYFKSRWSFCEDWDLSIRIADLGWGNVFSPMVLASYRMWDDTKNLRARRRIIAISELRAIYEETIEPIYRARGWNLARVRHFRRKRAKEFTDVLSSTVFSDKEKGDVLRLLKRLGDSPSLRCYIFLERLGLGGILQVMNSIVAAMKSALKLGISLLTHLRQRA
jgi:glycosyltransferase involved in cell wall biosynthesis